ncbi:MAG: hypothetical protein SWH61_03380 [Thermodesulfobacteriota bacterium]|nr:hypothetical protein [Thermodesulfobacteriota bacterium]
MAESQKILTGKDEICAYAKIGKSIFPDLIAKGFPAVYWGGKWRAYTDNIETFMRAATMPTGPQEDKDEE